MLYLIFFIFEALDRQSLSKSVFFNKDMPPGASQDACRREIPASRAAV